VFSETRYARNGDLRVAYRNETSSAMTRLLQALLSK
jgi:hypothetical protein